MIKLIILSIIGRERVSSRKLFNSIKTYLIFYMLVLPGLVSATGLITNSGDSSYYIKDQVVEIRYSSDKKVLIKGLDIQSYDIDIE